MEQSKVLTPEDLEVINAKFGLNLAYDNAMHYRAAQVIWNLWKQQEPTSTEKATDPD